VVVGSDGTFYQQMYACGPWFVDCRMSVRSRHPADTSWGPWHMVNGAVDTLTAYAGGQRYTTPVGASVLDVDRPWMAIDQSTNTLYLSVSANQVGVDPTNPEVQVLYVSHDGGVTWSDPLPLDYPGRQGSVLGNGVISAAHGEVAASYSGSIPGEDAACPCVVFETSSDEGKTWVRHRVPLTAEKPDLSFVAADPSHPGRYAVVVNGGDGSTIHVFTTSDSGSTWSSPAVLTTPYPTVVDPATPWLNYGPTGVLGVVWLPSKSDGSYDAWAAISPAGEAAGFLPPRQVSPANSSEGPSYQAGNDNPFVFLGAGALYAAWGGRHDGDLETWLARVPFRNFRR
jgi:hypothetical protein